MSDYLYAVIPYKSGLHFQDEDEDKFVCGYIPKELSDISIDFDEDCFEVFSDYILINTCCRMSSLNCNENGWCQIRCEIYNIAKALNAIEVWYVAELTTDAMLLPDFNFDDWKRSLKEESAYCTTEVTIEMLQNQKWASYCHDNFKDIVIEREFLYNRPYIFDAVP